MTDIISNNKKKLYCSNCCNIGHNYNQCNEPITSWGIILVNIIQNDNNKNDNNMNTIDVDLKHFNGIMLNNINDLKEACNYMNLIQFLLVRRKHSLGYSEFIRGHYINDNIDGIIYLFQQMTPDEIKNIKDKDFDYLWNNFWTGDTRKIMFNKKEYIESKEKFECLKNKIGVELPLLFYIKNVKSFYTYPEWGFPKGRKLRGESDMDCAVREFCEETGFENTDIKIITSVKHIIENIIGTNGVSYRHIYYLAENLSNKNPVINEKNNNEIGEIGFFKYDDAIQMFREYHIEKKNIIKNVFIYYINSFINKYNNQNNEIYWKIENDGF